MTILCCNCREEEAMVQGYRTLRVTETGEGVLSVVIRSEERRVGKEC